MKDDKGKVIFSLIAGATAGIVAGLLLAPETGDDTRSNLRKSAAKWADDLGKLAKDAVARVQGQAADPAADASAGAGTSEDKEAADRLLAGLRTPSTAHTHSADNPDYDGFGDDTRHRPKG